jgi:lipoprotein-releasing system ATP-binding protein
LLQVSNVSKRYATPAGPLTVLSDVTFALAPGEAAVITGPSGSGKSTLLYMLGGLEPPSEGSVALHGQDLFTMDASALADFRNREIGFVFQDHCLLPQCSVMENVLVPTLISRKAQNGNTEDFLSRARSLIQEVGLSSRTDHRPAELSGGEKQRVAIARALVCQPSLVLCDEPTGNLDPAAADNVMALLLDLHRRQRNILIVVTHSARVAAQFSIRFDLSGHQWQRVQEALEQ